MSSVPKILELRRYTEVFTPNELNDRLQIVLFLPSDTDLPIHQLALHLQVLGFDRLDNFLRLVAFQTMANRQFLASVAHGRNRRLFLNDIAKVDPAFGQFTNYDFAQAAEMRRVVSGKDNLIFFLTDLGSSAFEIEATGDFFPGLIQRIIHLLFVYFRNDIEGWHTDDEGSVTTYPGYVDRSCNLA